jgi:hypothetical protein
MQFVRHRTELARGLLLLDGSLVADVPARLAGQVAGLPRGFGGYFRGLVRGRVGNAAARLAGGLADGRGLIPRDIRGRPAGLVGSEVARGGLVRTWLVRRRGGPCVVGHRYS